MPQAEKESLTPEEQRRRAKAKIRTIRIWFWVVMALFAGFFFLSKCALSKPEAKQLIIDSCIKNVPFSSQWQTDLQKIGRENESDQLINGYCTCMWSAPLDKLTEKQIQSMSKMNAQEQLNLLGGAEVFEAQHRQCIANLKKSP